MILLHPQMSVHELTAYCALCHEYHIQAVHVDPEVVARVTILTKSSTYLGIKFLPK